MFSTRSGAAKLSLVVIIGLIDVKLPEAEEVKIKSCIVEHYSEEVSFHELRTRKAGSQRFIDLHLVMPKNASVETRTRCVTT